MKTELLDKLVTARAEKRPIALVTNLTDGQQTLVTPDTVEGAAGLSPEQLDSVRAQLRANTSTTLEIGDARLFVTVFNPPLRLLIVGAVHIAQALAPMAAVAGYEVTVIDPRGAFAAPERFPDITLSTDWPDEAMLALTPDSRTAVVTLTHDPKLDDAALEQALKSEAFYIGALGSRKTHAARCARLEKLGFTPNQIARIHGPIGLKLGGRAPSEIAIAALAQMTQVLHAEPEPAEAAA